MNSCPFSTSFPRNLSLPSVPFNSPDIPFVPRPSGDITIKTTMMGAPPSEKTQDFIEKKYQVRPPHSQNTLTPCEGKRYNPNSNPRQCYDIFNENQGVMGRVCTRPDADDILDSRQTYDGVGVNGNADWVRGNRFGVAYRDEMINDRVKIKQKVPVMLQMNKEYVNYDPFYPTKDFCMKNNCWFKTYPQTKLYTDTGYPTWNYPYNTTQPGSRSPVYLLSQVETKDDIDKVIEGFGNRKTNAWVGLVIVLLSLYVTQKKFL